MDTHTKDSIELKIAYVKIILNVRRRLEEVSFIFNTYWKHYGTMFEADMESDSFCWKLVSSILEAVRKHVGIF